MENRPRVSEIKKKFECLNSPKGGQTKGDQGVNNGLADINLNSKKGSNRQLAVNGKCHIKRSNAFRSDKFPPVGGKISECQGCSISNDSIQVLISSKTTSKELKKDCDLARNNDMWADDKLNSECKILSPVILKQHNIKSNNLCQNLQVPVRSPKCIKDHHNNVTLQAITFESCLKNDVRLLKNNSASSLRSSTSLSCNSLPETIKAALKTPLPEGPPPKKPPRTFKHIVGQVIASNKDLPKGVHTNRLVPELKLLLSADNKVPFSVKKTLPPIRSKTESQLLLNETSTSPLLDLRNKVPDLVPDCKQLIQNSMVSSNCNVSPKPMSFLCSLNCSSSGVSSGNIYDVPFEPKLFTDLQPCLMPSSSINGQNCYGLVNKPLNSDHIYSEPYFLHSKRKLKGTKTAKAILNRVITHQKKLNTDCHLSHDSANPLEENKPLHYMSSPIPEPDIQLPPGFTMAENSKNINSDKIPNRIIIPNHGASTTQVHEFQKVKSLLRAVYQNLDTKSNTDSDSDSVTSNADDVSSQEKTVSLEELSAKRKVYVRKMSSLKKFHSHLRKGNDRLFDVVLLIGLKADEPVTSCIKFCYPESASPQSNIEEFCFPDAADWSPQDGYIHTNYTLVLTDSTGDRTYGYCRRILPEGSNLCLPLAYCIISSNRSNGFYYKILMQLEELHGLPEATFKEFIHSLYNCKFPVSGETITVSNSIRFKRAKDWRAEYNDLAKVINIISIPTFLKVFSTMLSERKVILIGSNISKLSDCIEGLQTSLFPLFWQHTIAIIPQSKLELCECPTPFIFGVVKTKEEEPSFSHIDEAIIVDIDKVNSNIIKKVGDEKTIVPKKLYKCLKEALRISSMTDESNLMASEAIIRFFVETIGHFRSHLITSPDNGTRSFQKKSFIKDKDSRSIQLFLKWFVETSMFQVFINTEAERSYKPAINDNKLITLVQKHDALYNIHNLYYKDPNVRRKCWTEIAVEMNCEVSRVKFRWRYLKQLYYKNVNDGSNRLSKVKCDKLFFLKQCTNDIINGSTKPAKRIKVSEVSNVDSANIYKDPNLNIKNPPTDPIYNEPNVLPHFNLLNDNQMDSVTYFFMSIAKTVQSFPPLEQAKAKEDVLKLINEMDKFYTKK